MLADFDRVFLDRVNVTGRVGPFLVVDLFSRLKKISLFL